MVFYGPNGPLALGGNVSLQAAQIKTSTQPIERSTKFTCMTSVIGYAEPFDIYFRECIAVAFFASFLKKNAF